MGRNSNREPVKCVRYGDLAAQSARRGPRRRHGQEQGRFLFVRRGKAGNVGFVHIDMAGRTGKAAATIRFNPPDIGIYGTPHDTRSDRNVDGNPTSVRLLVVHFRHSTRYVSMR